MAPRKAAKTGAGKNSSVEGRVHHPEVYPIHAIIMVLVAAVVSTCSLASMSPIYGSIPSGAVHGMAMGVSVMAGFLFHYNCGPRAVDWVRKNFVWVIMTPFLRHAMNGSSDRLGPVLGPLLLGVLTCYPILAVTAYVFASFSITLQRDAGSYSVHNRATLAGSYFALIYILHQVLQSFLPTVLMWCNTWESAPWDHMSPAKLQVILLSFLVSPFRLARNRTMFQSAVLLLASTPLVLPTSSSLGSFGLTTEEYHWRSLEKTWSNTGYISVLENTAEHYRVLRCDHSLLGGEWLVTEERRRDQKWKVNEPIYHVFEMLEAVRLIQIDESPLDAANALVVGLGIGTAPKALIQHGINTTVVEIDPGVHKYATKYFGLPTNHTAVIQDAISWTSDVLRRRAPPTYQYVLHDVFTGGAEPLPLFTHTFISNLRRLLSADGVIAINYAGELSLPLTRRILHTIDSVFDGQCSAYADASPDEGEHDFLNMVLFCRNTAGPIEFRKPTAADFLASISRKNYLLPNPQHEVTIPGRNQDEGEIEVFHEHEARRWARQQRESAIRHWKIMRKIIPAVVWERY